MANLVVVVGDVKVRTVQDLKAGTVYRKAGSGEHGAIFMKVGVFGVNDKFHSLNLASGGLASFEVDQVVEELPEVRIIA